MITLDLTEDELRAVHAVLLRCVDHQQVDFDRAAAGSALDKIDLQIDELEDPEPTGCRHEHFSDGMRCRDCMRAFTLSSRSINHYMRVRGAACVSVVQAAQELRALAPTAKYKSRHGSGKALWRSGRPLQLRWVTEGLRIIWVGQGAPPRAIWSLEGAP